PHPGSTLFPSTTLFRSELDLAVVGHPQRIDRDRAVWIAEFPVELVSLDPDRLRPAGRGRRRVSDTGHLVEDEGGDRREDQHRARDRKSTRLNSSHVAIS